MDFSYPETWVRIGLLLFFGLLVVLKVPGLIVKAIDTKTLAIKAELDEALRIRQDAQELLNSLKLERLEAERQARELIANAEIEAARLSAEAKVKLDEQIARRQALAERKIAQAEAQAMAEVKAAAAELAMNAAQSVLEDRLKGKRTDPLIDKAIGSLAQKLAS